MTNIYETTDRLIDERLDQLRALGWDVDQQLQPASALADGRSHQPTMLFVRLVSAVRLLYQLHRIDAKGRCQICTDRPRLRRTRTRPCTVYSALSFYLTQHDELVLPELPRPPTAQPRQLSDAEQTMELPRIRGGQ